MFQFQHPDPAQLMPVAAGGAQGQPIQGGGLPGPA